MRPWSAQLTTPTPTWSTTQQTPCSAACGEGLGAFRAPCSLVVSRHRPLACQMCCHPIPQPCSVSAAKAPLFLPLPRSSLELSDVLVGGPPAGASVTFPPSAGAGWYWRAHNWRSKLRFQLCSACGGSCSTSTELTPPPCPTGNLLECAGHLAGGQWQAAEGDAGLRAQLSELVDRFQQLTQVPAGLLPALWLYCCIASGLTA
jgi:hypothetical protein